MPFGGLLTAAIIGGVGSIAGAGISASAAGHAADTQSQAALAAAQLQKQAQDDALAFQKQQWDTTQANLAPFLKAGTGAVTQLSSLLGPYQAPDGSPTAGGPFQNINFNGDYLPGSNQAQLGLSINEPWLGHFNAPTDITEQNDPGFQARLKAGTDALQASAAARGTLLSGATAKDLTRFGQEYGSNEYDKVYGRALNDYQLAYNTFTNNQTNQYNKLAALAGTGQVAANTLATTGQQAAGTNAQTLLTGATNIGNSNTNAAAARASGYVGGANAINSAIGGIGSNISSTVLLNQLLGKNGGVAPPVGGPGGTPGGNIDWSQIFP